MVKFLVAFYARYRVQLFELAAVVLAAVLFGRVFGANGVLGTAAVALLVKSFEIDLRDDDGGGG